MPVMFERCAGLDCHKKQIVACRLIGAAGPTPQVEIRSFGTTTAALLQLSDWLSAGEVTHVALESTGVYWKPVFNILEGSFNVWILNAQHVKNGPGRKTDGKDAQWLADLLRHGLVQPSFIPSPEQRDLRDLTRERTNFIRTCATLVNRVQKVLEAINIKLGDGASDIFGVSGRAILTALIGGETDANVLANLAKGRLRRKREELAQALEGRMRGPQRFLLTELLCQIASLEETIARCDEAIDAACADEAVVLELLDTIPGGGRAGAELILAEIGTDLSRFPTAAHLAAWAGLAPGNNESAGKRRPAKTREGNVWLRTGLVQAAHGAVRTESYRAAQYRRRAARRGYKRAIIAVAHSILVIIYYVITRREPYQELGADYFERRKPEAVARKLVRQIEKLGDQVQLSPQASAA